MKKNTVIILLMEEKEIRDMIIHILYLFGRKGPLIKIL